MDLERLGALLEGRLAQDERAELLARLAASEEARDVFADTAAVLRELDEEDAAPAAVARTATPATGTVSGAARRPRRLPAWALGGIAAGIALAVALPLTLRSRGLPSPETTLEAFTARGGGLPAYWPNAWPAARGEGEVADAGATASRLGVTHLHLLLAVASNDSSAKAEAIAGAQDLLAGEWALAAEEYRELSGRGVTREQIAEAGAEVARTVGESRFRLGAWAEAARLAAARRDPAFFRSRATRSALDHAARLSDLPAPAPTAIQELSRLRESRGSPDWPALQRATSQLAASLTS